MKFTRRSLPGFFLFGFFLFPHLTPYVAFASPEMEREGDRTNFFNCANIAGEWTDSLGNAISVVQNERQLTFYFSNSTYTGVFINDWQIQAFTNLIGTLNSNGTISWTNGVVFTRASSWVPYIAGNWEDTLGNAISVQQNGSNLTFLFPNGIYTGVFINSTQLRGFTNLVGTLDPGGCIRWSNGVTFTRAPTSVPAIGGYWRDTLGNAITIVQSGAGLTFYYPNATYTGVIVNGQEIRAFTNLTGFLTASGTISWSNGVTFYRARD